MHKILCLLFCFFAINGFSQNAESKTQDTTSFESRCDCLKFKEELLNNISFDENERVVLDSTYLAKHKLNSKKLFSLTKQCDQYGDAKLTQEPCPFDDKIKGLEEEIQLILRVIEMNNTHNGCGDVSK